MKKRLLLIAVLAVVLVGFWVGFNFFYYSAPRMPVAEIKNLAEKELRQEAGDMLKNNNPRVNKKLASLEVLQVGNINDKTYLVFKLDYIIESAQQRHPYDFGGYMLGLRLVERQWGGIKLKRGMEFETSYPGGTSPVECGYLPEGVFFGFCKDPRVEKGYLQLDDDTRVELKVENRTILAEAPQGSTSLSPRFFTGAGQEIEMRGGMKAIFISDNDKNFAAYSNVPLQWWALDAADIDYLSSEEVDMVWVFPDQHQQVLQGEAVVELKKLVNRGIPLVFIGMKDVGKMARVFGPGCQVKEGHQEAGDEVEAVYVGRKKGLLEAGVITLNDDSQGSPLLEQSVALRYEVELPQDVTRSSGAKEAKGASAPSKPLETKQVQGRVVP